MLRNPTAAELCAAVQKRLALPLGPPALGEHTVTQPTEAQPPLRPESDLGKGMWAGSKGLLIGLGVGSLLLALLIVVLVIRKRLRARGGDDVGPISSRGSVRPPPSSRPARRL